MIAPDTFPAPSGSSPPHPWGDPAAWEVGGRKGKRNSSAAGMMSRCLSRVLFVFWDQRSCPWAVGLGAGCASCPVGKGAVELMDFGIWGHPAALLCSGKGLLRKRRGESWDLTAGIVGESSFSGGLGKGLLGALAVPWTCHSWHRCSWKSQTFP